MLKHGVGILKLITNALAELHSSGIVHRDICPNNIFISENFDSVQLTGFYNSCFIKKKDNKIQTGTYPYFTRTNSKFSQSSCRWDYFALGVIAFEIIECPLMF